MGAREMLDAIKARASSRYSRTTEVWAFSNGFSIGEPGILFLLKGGGTKGEEWACVMIHNESLGPGLPAQDHPHRAGPMRLVALTGGPHLVFNQREGFLEGHWNPKKFAAAGMDPVEVAMRMIEAVLASQAQRPPCGMSSQ